MKNTWEFEGEIVRMKEYDTSRFTHNLTIRGMYEGNENSSNCIVEFGCMVPKTVKATGNYSARYISDISSSVNLERFNESRW